MALMNSDLPKLVELLNLIDIRVKVRRHEAADWVSLDEVLLEGEIGLEIDTGNYKWGNGSSGWNSLPYAGSGDIAAAIHAAAVKSAPVGADEFAIADSEDAYGLKKLSLADLKSALVGDTGGIGMTLLGAATVAGSAATVLTLSGLDLSLYRSFTIIMRMKNAVASASDLSMYFNGDTTPSNYTRQSLNADGGTVSAARANTAQFGTIPASSTFTSRLEIINDSDGKPRVFSYGNRDGATVLKLSYFNVAWNTAANITSISVSASVANSLAVGSEFAVFGLS